MCCGDEGGRRGCGVALQVVRVCHGVTLCNTRGLRRLDTCRYYQPYSHHTYLSDIEMPGGGYHLHCMLMGAKNGASSSTLALAAIIDASTFHSPTTKNSPRLTRGVYWHMTDGTLTVACARPVAGR